MTAMDFARPYLVSLVPFLSRNKCQPGMEACQSHALNSVARKFILTLFLRNEIEEAY